MGNIGFALLLSALAGLSTTIGSLLGIAVRKPGPKFMTLTLGFSAGVMIHVSFVELLQGGVEFAGFMPAHVAFFLGMAVMFAIDSLIPHDYLGQEEHSGPGMRSSSLLKTGMFVALELAVAALIVADELYRSSVPVLVVSEGDAAELLDGRHVRIEHDGVIELLADAAGAASA